MALPALRPSLLSYSFSHRLPLARTSTAHSATSAPSHVKVQHRSVSLASYVVTPKELHDALKKNVRTKISTSPRVIPLCAAWFMPNDPERRRGIDVFRERRIPQARFFDIDDVKDPDSPYPHMLPSKDRFAEAMRAMGIRRDDQVVVYDTEELGLMSAPRVGWTLRLFGHPNVHVLNNFRLWVREGYPTESGSPAAAAEEKPVDYEVDGYNHGRVIDFAEVQDIAKDYGKEGSDAIQILDARPRGRWEGTDREPRPELPSGHIPGSHSVPFAELLDPETKSLLPPEELQRIFESKGIDSARPTISSCGSGVTAAVVDLALEQADYGSPESRRVYDGSWT